MYIVKVLKRKDAASVVVAVLLALLILGPIQTIPMQWAHKIVTETEFYTDGNSWEQIYLIPLLTLVFQLLLIEVGLRVVIAVRDLLVRREK